MGFRRKQQFKPAKVRGFTIVELLIVIVVIGILAAISIVAYNTISQKANNAAIIQAASNSLKVIQAYIAQEGKYPVTTTGQACITIDSGCADSNIAVTAGSTLHTEIQKVGGLPKGTTRLAGTTRYGVIYDYRTRNFNGDSQPVILLYYLQGTGQQCGIPGVTNQSAGDMVGSTSGYTTADSGGKTACVITIPGPAA